MNWWRPSQNTITTNCLRPTPIRMFIRLQTVYCLVQKWCKNFPPMTQFKTSLSNLQSTFIQKIVIIRNRLCQNINTDNHCDETGVISILGSPKPAADEEISKIIRSSASKSCDLDPISTWLLKRCLSELLPVITYIVNLSLSTSTVHYELKRALIPPLLKKYCWIPRSKTLPPCL